MPQQDIPPLGVMGLMLYGFRKSYICRRCRRHLPQCQWDERGHGDTTLQIIKNTYKHNLTQSVHPYTLEDIARTLCKWLTLVVRTLCEHVFVVRRLRLCASVCVCTTMGSVHPSSQNAMCNMLSVGTNHLECCIAPAWETLCGITLGKLCAIALGPIFGSPQGQWPSPALGADGTTPGKYPASDGFIGIYIYIDTQHQAWHNTSLRRSKYL